MKRALPHERVSLVRSARAWNAWSIIGFALLASSGPGPSIAADKVPDAPTAIAVGSSSPYSSAIAPDKPSLKSPEKPVAEADVETVRAKLHRAVGSVVTIDMKNGKSLLHVTLVKVIDDPDKQAVMTLKVQQSSEEAKPLALNFAGVEAITLDHEKIYEAPASAYTTAFEKRAQIEAEKAAKEREKWVARHAPTIFSHGPN